MRVPYRNPHELCERTIERILAQRDEARAEAERLRAVIQQVSESRVRTAMDEHRRQEYTGIVVSYAWACQGCGALVVDRDQHDEWHQLTTTALDGEPCTCGYGGVHEPENSRCERNVAAMDGERDG